MIGTKTRKLDEMNAEETKRSFEPLLKNDWAKNPKEVNFDWKKIQRDPITCQGGLIVAFQDGRRMICGCSVVTSGAKIIDGSL